MAPALALALALLASAPVTPLPNEEALPAGAPTDPYLLTAWCYGALGEYLDIYETVKPDLREIDAMFGSPVREAEPYSSDIAEAKKAKTRFARTLQLAERASPSAISAQGAEQIRRGQGIWSAAKLGTRRQLTRAWLYWGLPGQCERTSNDLAKKSAVFGQALNANVQSAVELAAEAPVTATEPPPPPEAVPPALDPVKTVAAPPPPPPEPEPAPPPAAPPVATPPPSATSARADFVYDLDNPRPCPGRLESEKRGGREVLVCRVQ